MYALVPDFLCIPCLHLPFVTLAALFPSCSAYTEAYKVCTVAAGPQMGFAAETLCEEDQGRTSEEEEGTDINYDRQVGSPAC